MALDNPKEHIHDRVRGTIFNDPDNLDLHTVRTTAKGTFSQTGLKNGGRNTTLDVGDTATAMPVFSSRNALSIHNTSETEILYVGFDTSVTADSVIGTTSGRQVGPGQILNFDATDNISLYAVAETGKTIRVHVMELA